MRLPKRRKKKVKGHLYWFTAAAGGKYFGKVGEVSHKKAQRHFAEHLRKGQYTVSAEAITVSKLFHHFLEWVGKNRCRSNYKRRRAECNRFARFVYGDRRLADILEKLLRLIEEDSPRVRRGRDRQQVMNGGTKSVRDRQRRDRGRVSAPHQRPDGTSRHALDAGGSEGDAECPLPLGIE